MPACREPPALLAVAPCHNKRDFLAPPPALIGQLHAGFALRLLLLAAAALHLAGCGSLRTYRQEMDATLGRVVAGDVAGAIKDLEKNNKGNDRDLLFHLELGELHRLNGAYPRSLEAFRAADAVIQAWEQTAKLDPSKLSGSVASFLVNDKVRVYEGIDYEKVMVTTRMAMDYLAMGDWDNARVHIKRSHEREALIAEVRARQYVDVQEEALRKGARQSFKEIGGYPVQTLEVPEALALKNGYQNALSHYLAGFVYEALGEGSLAAPGYRTAIELRPGEALLEDSLGGLDKRLALGDDGKCDALFVVETGLAPVRASRDFNLPIPLGPNGNVIFVSASFPVLSDRAAYSTPTVTVDRSLGLGSAHVLDVDAMARRALADEMPSIMLRTFSRSAARALAQYEMQRQMEEARRRNRGEDNLGMALGLLALQIGGIVLESADERAWRSLPGHVAVARGRLSRGVHAVQVDTASGAVSFDVNLSASHAVVAVRVAGGRPYVTPGEPLPPAGSKSATNDPAPGAAVFVSILQSDRSTPVVPRRTQ